MNPVNQPVIEHKLEFETKEIMPVFTYFCVFGLLIVFFIAKSDKGHEAIWLDNNGWSNARYALMMSKADITGLAMLALKSTFASFNMVQMALNAYFFWVFARHLEQKIGTGRFILVLTIAIFAPWFILARTVNDDITVFFGPALCLSTLIGAYMVFPPVPKSKIGQGSLRDRNQIFNKQKPSDPIEKYTRNPWMFVGVFIVIQTLIHFWLTVGFAIFERMPGDDNVALLPMLAGAAIGYGFCELLARSATSNIKESGVLTVEALRKYNELINLDVNHENALRGTARHMGLPYDKVKEWVAKNKGKLRVK